MTFSPRVPRHRYVDPLDQLWLATAERLGFRVRRSSDAYASTDGHGVMTLGSDETLDPDDCLAQMILHECCHWLVEGDDAMRAPDWGLDNVTDRDVPREMASLRLQALLTDRHGLRAVLAPTTDFREFYDALPADPLAPRHDPAVAPAIRALGRLDEPRWLPLHEALEATGAIARAARRISSLAQVEDEDPLPSLWLAAGEPAGTHPLGRPESSVAGRTCGDCAWHFRGGPGRATDRCRQADGARIDPQWRACERWEDPLDCGTCGACCRAAYDVVIVSPRDPVMKTHPELIVRGDQISHVRREGDRCAGLEGGPSAGVAFERWTCAIYDDRPRTCRDFALGGVNCLTARQRVGLSP